MKLLNQKVLFNKVECESIVWNVNESIANFDMSNRKYHSQPIKYSPNIDWLFDKLKNFFEQETGLQIIKNKEEIHFHKFVKGNWFDKHNDVKNSRMYAVGVLLNDNFEGGDFKLYNPNEIILDKVIGNTYLFDVRIDHKITPVLEGERYSLLWFLENKHIKIKTNKLI
jgi:Rps23 Pro-64 3,4-dihydroxylase Tpa1-like proline 4-hydroxylase